MRRGEWAHVAIEQDDGDAGFAQTIDEADIGGITLGHVLEGSEENAGDFALDELVADFFGVAEGGERVQILGGTARPPKHVTGGTGEAGPIPRR